jgi:hypothetical protein
MSVLGDNHVVGKCGHEDWADASYPRAATFPATPSDLMTLILEART